MTSLKKIMAEKSELEIKTENELDEKDVQKMIKYLTEHTKYRVVTDDEFNLKFHIHSSPKQTSVQDENAPPRPPPPSCNFELSKIPPATPVRTFSSSAISGNLSNWQRPRLPTFSGDQKGETTFDVWKFEVKCIVREGNYSNTVLLQSIRSSLKGQARSLLLTLPETATPNQIFEKLELVFGNVYSSEALLQKFYMEKQEPNQTVADYGMKLESILQSAIEKGHISPDSKDEMLRSKFWSGLSDPLLRNACRHKYYSIKNFDTLRREIRAIGLDLVNSSTSSKILFPSNLKSLRKF